MSSSKSMLTGQPEETLTAEQRMKIQEVRNLVGLVSGMGPTSCSDSSIIRYLAAKNWNANKASQMLREILRWRKEFKPEAIRWKDIAEEAKDGKIYRAKYLDKSGRPVLVMKLGIKDTDSSKRMIRYWIYCMENCILNFQDNKEGMVWLIDFHGWTMGNVSINVTRETAHMLDNYYPELLGIAILYNPPKIFEQFLKIVRLFLQGKTYEKIRFVYSDDTDSKKVMEEMFDLDNVESVFDFEYDQFRERMVKDEMKFYTSKERGKDGMMITKTTDLKWSMTQPSEEDEEALLNVFDERSSSVDCTSKDSEVKLSEGNLA